MSIIEKIRNKPHAGKNRIIWITVNNCCSAACCLWVFSANYHKNAVKDTTLFQAFGQGLQNIKDNYRNNYFTKYECCTNILMQNHKTFMYKISILVSISN